MAFIDDFDSFILEPAFTEGIPYHEYYGNDMIDGTQIQWQRCLIAGTDCLVVSCVPPVSVARRADMVQALQDRGNHRGHAKVGQIVHIFYVNVDESTFPL